jgi:cytochrome b pre-mRNA-processing protein 3
MTPRHVAPGVDRLNMPKAASSTRLARSMTFLDRLFRPSHRVLPGDALYRSLVAEARVPDWYLAGAVPDTVDGRFDAVALVLALVLLRLEHEGDGQRQFSADLTERFIADMDGSLRELGIGDPTVGKQVGKMVSALGGRLGAYRDALAGGEALETARARNLYRGAPAAPAALDWAARRTRSLSARIDAVPLAALVAGAL